MLTYHIITFGCQMNFNDSERIAGIVKNLKLKKAKDRFRADLVIVNTCGVRQSAEDRVIGIVPKIRKKNPTCTIIVTGCSAHRKDFQKKLASSVNHFIGILELPQFLKELARIKTKIRDKNQKKSSPVDFFKIHPLLSSSSSAYVPIMTGCNNFCSYCVVPYARGREFSRLPKDILQEIERLVADGYKEIILLGQNVNSYRPKLSKSEKINSFPVLLKEISQISEDFWIRFLTSHPKDMSDDLIETIAGSRKITNYIHLPFQSGSNKILKSMKRKYTIEHYLQLIAKIRTKIPRVTISTDIIVGFPGETKEDFGKTARIMETVGFDMAYISSFSSRPGTVAAKLEDNVSQAEKKERKRILTEILKQTALRNNQEYIGKEVKVLIKRHKIISISKEYVYLGKTETYKNVRVKATSSQSIKVGSFCKVKVTGAGAFGLEGTVMLPACHSRPPRLGEAGEGGNPGTPRRNFTKIDFPKFACLPACRQAGSGPPLEPAQRMQGGDDKSLSNSLSPPLIVILGPTACGKTKLAVKLAKKFNGEIVSADSRQVYRGLDIGTGKDLKEYSYQEEKIPYHLIDVADPQENFSLADYQKKAYQAINEILKRKKLPFLVGGTGLYLKSITDGIILSSAKPDYNLRRKLELMDNKNQLQILKKLDPEILKKIDPDNPRRVIRAIEICQQVSKKPSRPKKTSRPRYSSLILGITYPIDEIRARIKERLEERLAQGLVKEVQKLRKNGLSWKRLADFGLEYRYIAHFLRKKITYDVMVARLIIANGQLAKKQMTWFKKDTRIKWIGTEQETEKLIHKHISNR